MRSAILVVIADEATAGVSARVLAKAIAKAIVMAIVMVAGIGEVVFISHCGKKGDRNSYSCSHSGSMVVAIVINHCDKKGDRNRNPWTGLGSGRLTCFHKSSIDILLTSSPTPPQLL